MKKKIGLLSVIFIIALIGLQYYKVNKDIPQDYYTDEFVINEKINLESCNLTIHEVSYRIKENKEKENTHNVEVVLEILIDNINDKKFNFIDLMDGCKLGIGILPSNFNDNEGKIEKVKDKNQMRFTMVCNLYSIELNKISKTENIKFYIAPVLYKDEVKKYYDQGKLYCKCVKLGVFKDVFKK